MKVHTENPQLYMSEVEKNLITPVTLAKYNLEIETSSQLPQQYSSSSTSTAQSSVLFLPLQTLKTMTNVPTATAAGTPTTLQSPFSPLSAALAQMSPTLPEDVSIPNLTINPKLSPPLNGLTMFSSKDLPLITAAATTAASVEPTVTSTTVANAGTLNLDAADTSADSNTESHSPTNSSTSSDAATTTSSKSISGKYKCQKCDAVFDGHLDLECHNKFHGANLSCSCSLCDYSVATADELANHLTGHHSNFDADNQIQKSDEDEIVDVEHIENADSIRLFLGTAVYFLVLKVS
uniref:C2H2-type domain-containing protein n=1 Tax=Syphacia muris TaxID=451379 RepID=A0A0N5ABP2_9BILA